jgi:hypothetical protein
MKTKNPHLQFVLDGQAALECLNDLVRRYRRETFIACITPGARQDAKRGSESARIFAEWDRAHKLTTKYFPKKSA